MAFKDKSGNVLSQSQIGITHVTVGATYVSDCNSAIAPNTEYYTNMSSENRPDTSISTFNLWAHQVNSNSIVQFAISKNTDSILYMRQYNGIWGDWFVVTKPLDIYPIGSVYTSNTSTNPAQYFGGTWTQISAVEPCILHASKIVTPSSRTYAEMFTLTEVQTLLNTAFGIDTSDINADNVAVSATSNYWTNGNIAVLNVFYNTSDTTYYAYFSGTTSLNQQLQYTILFNREMYKFVRVA